MIQQQNLLFKGFLMLKKAQTPCELETKASSTTAINPEEKAYQNYPIAYWEGTMK